MFYKNLIFKCMLWSLAAFIITYFSDSIDNNIFYTFCILNLIFELTYNVMLNRFRTLSQPSEEEDLYDIYGGD